MRRTLHVLIPFLLVLPFLILIWKTPLHTGTILRNASHIFDVILHSSLQAILSAGASLALGTIAACGLLSIEGKAWLHIFRGMALLPAILPPIVLSSFLIFQFDQFPFSVPGLLLVVVAHSLANFGMVAILLESYTRRRLSEQLLVARAMGASSFYVLRKIALPQWNRQFTSGFFLVVGFCLMSFVPPLMLAPGEVWSLEVYIYNILKVNFDYQLAMISALSQVLVLSVFVLLLYPSGWQSKAKESEAKLLCFPYFLFLPAVTSAVFVLGSIVELALVSGLSNEMEDLFWHEWLAGLKTTAQITSISLLFSLCLLLAALMARPRERLHRFIVAYVASSPVVLGFSLWSLGANERPWDLIKVGIGISLLYFPILYRWRIGSHLDTLRGQAMVARTLGASEWRIFTSIVLPQSRSMIVSLLVIMSFWASGDFVMTSILSFSTSSLPVLVETLSTSYRLSLAAFTSVSILVFGALVAGLIVGFDRLIFERPNRV